MMLATETVWTEARQHAPKSASTQEFILGSPVTKSSNTHITQTYTLRILATTLRTVSSRSAILIRYAGFTVLPARWYRARITRAELPEPKEPGPRDGPNALS
jgi:hypothetical protein